MCCGGGWNTGPEIVGRCGACHGAVAEYDGWNLSGALYHKNCIELAETEGQSLHDYENNAKRQARDKAQPTVESGPRQGR